MALLDRNNGHPTVKKIQYGYNGITENNKRAVFCWVQSHMGILRDEIADQAARAASVAT